MKAQQGRVLAPRARLLVVTFIVTGTALMQLAWMLTVPPFRGVDEFDHAYRASSVASGYLLVKDAPLATNHGYLIPARPDVVRASNPVCDWYPYTRFDNCNAVQLLNNGLVTVASGAARYSPAYYLPVGYLASHFDGLAFLYAMRTLTALICLALVGLAAWLLTLWAKTVWPFAALLLALTPVTLYSFSIAAPNGPELAAALALWAGLLGLGQAANRAATTRLLIGSSVAAVPLITFRTLGPLWFVLIVAIAILVLGRAACARLWSDHRWLLVVLALVTGICTAAAAGWSVIAGSNAPPDDAAFSFLSIGDLAVQSAIWVFQSIAAFPTRNELAPMPVYALSLSALVVFIFAAVKSRQRRVSVAMALVAALSLAVPSAFTLATYSSLGYTWQGRYTLPVAYGFVFLAGLALERGAAATRLARPGLGFGLLLVLSALLIGMMRVLLHERRESPLAGDDRWWTLPPAAVALLVVIGVVCWHLSVRRLPSTPPVSRVCDLATSSAGDVSTFEESRA